VARTATRSEIRDRVRRLADQRASQRFTDAELNDDIDLAVAQVYGQIVAARGAKFFEDPTPETFSTVAGTATYNLPSDFWQLSRLCVVVDGREYGLNPFMDNEVDGTRPVNSVWSCRLYHVPACPKLAADGSTFDGINGWEDLVAINVAIKCKQTNEEDCSVLFALQAKEEARIEALKQKRDLSKPHRISDVYARNRRMWPSYDYTGDRPRYMLKNGVIELREGFAEL
jgi:hypothetical protein